MISYKSFKTTRCKIVEHVSVGEIFEIKRYTLLIAAYRETTMAKYDMSNKMRARSVN